MLFDQSRTIKKKKNFVSEKPAWFLWGINCSWESWRQTTLEKVAFPAFYSALQDEFSRLILLCYRRPSSFSQTDSQWHTAAWPRIGHEPRRNGIGATVGTIGEEQEAKRFFTAPPPPVLPTSTALPYCLEPICLFTSRHVLIGLDAMIERMPYRSL